MYSPKKNFLFTFRMSMEVEGSLVIAQVAEDDEAKYQCLAKNVVGTRGSEKAQLSVLGKIFFLSFIKGPKTSVYEVNLSEICLRKNAPDSDFNIFFGFYYYF